MFKDFHSRVDGKGPTISLVKSSKGKTSCGYTSVSWESPSNSIWKCDPDACLMQLDNLTKYPVIEREQAVLHYKGCGIFFGNHLEVGNNGEPMNGKDKSYSGV